MTSRSVRFRLVVALLLGAFRLGSSLGVQRFSAGAVGLSAGGTILAG